MPPQIPPELMMAMMGAPEAPWKPKPLRGKQSGAPGFIGPQRPGGQLSPWDHMRIWQGMTNPVHRQVVEGHPSARWSEVRAAQGQPPAPPSGKLQPPTYRQPAPSVPPAGVGGFAGNNSAFAIGDVLPGSSNKTLTIPPEQMIQSSRPPATTTLKPGAYSPNTIELPNPLPGPATQASRLAAELNPSRFDNPFGPNSRQSAAPNSGPPPSMSSSPRLRGSSLNPSSISGPPPMPPSGVPGASQSLGSPASSTPRGLTGLSQVQGYSQPGGSMYHRPLIGTIPPGYGIVPSTRSPAPSPGSIISGLETYGGQKAPAAGGMSGLSQVQGYSQPGGSNMYQGKQMLGTGAYQSPGGQSPSGPIPSGTRATQMEQPNLKLNEYMKTKPPKPAKGGTNLSRAAASTARAQGYPQGPASAMTAANPGPPQTRPMGRPPLLGPGAGHAIFFGAGFGKLLHDVKTRAGSLGDIKLQHLVDQLEHNVGQPGREDRAREEHLTQLRFNPQPLSDAEEQELAPRYRPGHPTIRAKKPHQFHPTIRAKK